MKKLNLSAWALNHQPLMRYLIAVLVITGIFSYFQLGQDEDPPFTFRAMVIQTFWPGATPTQMAELVADRVEKKLQEVPYMAKIRTYTKAGESLTILEAAGHTPPKEVPNVWYQVRKKLGDIRGTLPSGVIGPVFNDEFGDTYGVIYSLSADGFNKAELKDYADRVRQQLLRVKDVNKVELFGVQDDRIFVEVSHQKLAQLGIDVGSLANQLNAQNTIEGSGTVVLPTDNVVIRVSGGFNALEDLKALPVRAGNSTIKLGDFATVTRTTIDPPRSTMRANGKEVIGLGISMQRGGDIIALGKALEAAEKTIQSGLPVGIEMTKVADQPKAVKGSVGEFVRVLIEAVVIVLVVSFLSLGLHTKPLRVDARPGLVVGLTIPLVLAITFLCMRMLDINLHKISLGALIIALGLLVDDAIIAVEMMVRKLEEGYDKIAAATAAYETTAIPMLTGTLITAAGFVPVGLAKSVAGEYTFSIFAVTALALIISWFAAVLFVPLLGVWILKVKPHAGAEHHEMYDTPFYSRFRRLVDWCVQHRWIVIGITALSLVLGVMGMGKVEKQFFPDSSRPELLVDMWMPEGSSFQATQAQAVKFEQWLKDQPEVQSYLTYVGTGSPRFYLPLDQIFPQPNVAQLVITPKDLAARNALRLKTQEKFRTDFPEVRGRVKLLPNGPPVPYPVQFRVEGPDPKVVRGIADQVKEVMRANQNTVGVNDNWNEQVKVLKLQIDQDKARALGVSTQTVQRAAQTILSGSTIGQFREGDRLIDIVLRQPLDERDTLTKLADANIPTASGRYVPVSQVVQASFEWEPGVIWRENRDYAITVQSDVKDGIQGPTVTTQVDTKLQEIRAKLTPGYVIKVAGAAESSAEAQASIMAYLPLMLFIVLTLLMLQLHSFGRTMLVYLTGPLGIVGAAATLLLFNAPFGFVAQLGVIALLGMIIRNSVILIDQIEHDIANGVHAWHAVVEAAVRRCRPIVLTAAAAVLAMIPLSRSVFWGPMAVAIMGGLIVATVLTLLFLPALYAAAFRLKRPA